MGIILALEILLKPFAICYENRGLRHTVCELLRSQADFEVCEQAENGKETIEKVQQYGAADYVQRICRWLL